MMSDSNAVDGLLSSFPTRLHRASPLPFHSSIYRVPEALGRYNETAPNLVSIGPFHHGGARLQAMEKMKLWYLKCLIYKETYTTDKSLGHEYLSYLIRTIREDEIYFRDCYEERFPLSSDEFVEMMLVDGGFIIEFLLKQVKLSPVEAEDAIFKTPWMLSTITNDLLLVENQLPWKVLDCLVHVTGRGGAYPSICRLVCNAFQNPTFVSKTVPNSRTEFESSHLLETVRKFSVQSNVEVRNTEDIEYRTPIPSVSELLEIGVKFVAASSNVQLRITFQNGKMEIPPIIIKEDGESFIRNIIAYEQCARQLEQRQMTSYAILFSQLIESVQDVDFLIQKKIITTELSKVSTASFFKRLSNGTEATEFFYSDLAKEVNEYIKRRWLRTWLVRLKRNYLYNPSSFWSVSNGVAVILILTLTQTIYSVLSYYK